MNKKTREEAEGRARELLECFDLGADGGKKPGALSGGQQQWERLRRSFQMTEEITKDIYRIGVGLPDHPLKELNSYFIRGRERSLLIDTGFRRPECEKDLREGLQELYADFDHLDVFATHLHADHCGMVRDFASEDGTIYVSGPDLKRLRTFLDE